MRKIGLLGGDGDVGGRLAQRLHEHSSYHIVLIGRNGQKAATVAESVGKRCEGIALDVSSDTAYQTLRQFDLCVNLTETTPADLVAKLIAHGIHIIDSAATPTYVDELRKAINAIPAPRATAVLETGLAPGLTNLLADQVCRQHPEVTHIDTLIEMGMGTHHGLAATEWTLKALGAEYATRWQGQVTSFTSGVLTRHFYLADERILGIGFAFSDQLSIAQAHDLTSARTFLAVTPHWMTRVLRWLSRSPLRPSIQRHARKISTWLLHMPTMGSDGTRLIQEARDADNHVVATVYLAGATQAELTAHVLAETSLALLSAPLPQNGLLPLTEIISTEQIVSSAGTLFHS